MLPVTVAEDSESEHTVTLLLQENLVLLLHWQVFEKAPLSSPTYYYYGAYFPLVLPTLT